MREAAAVAAGAFSQSARDARAARSAALADLAADTNAALGRAEMRRASTPARGASAACLLTAAGSAADTNPVPDRASARRASTPARGASAACLLTAAGSAADTNPIPDRASTPARCDPDASLLTAAGGSTADTNAVLGRASTRRGSTPARRGPDTSPLTSAGSTTDTGAGAGASIGLGVRDTLPIDSAGQALAYLDAALDYLAHADAASWPEEAQADCLRALAVAESRQVAAHARVLSAFSVPGGGLAADGHRSPRIWLTWQTQATRRAAATTVGWMRRLSSHPALAAALAAGQLSVSWARQIADWTDRLPRTPGLRPTKTC